MRLQIGVLWYLLLKPRKRKNSNFHSRRQGLGQGSTNGQSQRSWGNHPSVDSPPSCPPQLFPNFGYQQRDYENQGLSFTFREPRSPPEQRPVVTTSSVGLPKINMISLDGDMMKWTRFWTEFNIPIITLNQSILGETDSGTNGR